MFLLSLALFFTILSCKKNDNTPTVTPSVTTGVYTLNQGLYGQNNTTLTYYDFASSTPPRIILKTSTDLDWAIQEVILSFMEARYISF